MNDKNKKPSLLRYKLAALIGTIIMAVGAFTAFAVGKVTGNLWVGLLAGMAAWS